MTEFFQWKEPNGEKDISVTDYYRQALFFLEAVNASNAYAENKIASNPSSLGLYKEFEGVITGVCHAFAAELLLKGIILLRSNNLSKGTHDIKSLTKNEHCLDVIKTLKNKFNPIYHSNNMEKSFDDLLEQHSGNFKNIRYVFEKKNASVDVKFTTFFCSELKYYLKKTLGY